MPRSAWDVLPIMAARCNGLPAQNYFQEPAKPWRQTVLRQWLAEAETAMSGVAGVGQSHGQQVNLRPDAELLTHR